MLFHHDHSLGQQRIFFEPGELGFRSKPITIRSESDQHSGLKPIAVPARNRSKLQCVLSRLQKGIDPAN
jgi:hypothetical protein